MPDFSNIILSEDVFQEQWVSLQGTATLACRLNRLVRSEALEIQDKEVNTDRGPKIMAELHQANIQMKYYDLVLFHLHNFVRDRLKKKEPFSILEVGTGHGYVITSIAKHLGGQYEGGSFFGLDINPDFIEFAKANAESAGVEIEFFATDALKFARDSERKFDFIILSMVAHHMKPYYLYRFLAAMVPLTNKGVFIIDVRRDFFNIVKTKLFSLWNFWYSSDFKSDAIQSMRRSYTVDELNWLVSLVPGYQRVAVLPRGDVFLTLEGVIA